MLHLGKATVINLLWRLTVIADSRARMQYRTAIAEGIVVTARFEKVAFKELD